MDNTGLYDFPQHESGDTFNGITFTVTKNSAVLDLTNALIVATFILQTNKSYVKTLEVGSGITITHADAGVFQITSQVIGWRAGTYNYEIKFTLENGTVKTYIEGIWIITN